MRRTFARPAGVIVAVAVTCAALAATAGPPRSLRLSWARSQTAGTMTIAWNTSTEDGTQVRWGLDTTYPNVTDGPPPRLAPGRIGWVHEVTLEGLRPDTVYHYRVGSPMGWSEEFSFRSPPAPDGCTPFSFVALGDNRSDDNRGPSPKWAGILGEAIQDDPAFVINTGDLVKEGKESDQWALFLEETSAHAAYVPLLPSIGNHDDDSVEGDDAIYNTIFALPPNEVNGTEDFYWFTYGDAIFVALSTASFAGGAAPYELQAAWLDRVLTENPKPWKFVFFHHPPYTGYVDLFGLDVNHPPNENDQNPAIVPILDKHHVDIVFNGHNHFYQRFQPLRYSTRNPEEGIPMSDAADGTYYVITGGAGALTYAIDIYMWGLCAFTPGAEACSGKHHYVVVSIDGNRLQYTALTTAQQLLGSDPRNVQVIDSFEIVKPGYAPHCVAPPVDEGPRPDAGSTDVTAPRDVTTPPRDVAVPDVPAPPRPDVPAARPDVPTPDVGPPPREDVAQPTVDAGAPGVDTGQHESDAGAIGEPSARGGCAAGSDPLPPATGLLVLALLLGLCGWFRVGAGARRRFSAARD
jgi:hypothetical protein